MKSVHEDGHGNALDESGRYVQEMGVDDNESPLNDATDFAVYLAEEPPERQKKNKQSRAASSTEPNTSSNRNGKRYNSYSDMQKEQFFFLYHEKLLTAGKAAAKLGIPRSTAYTWVKKNEEEPSDEIQQRKVPKAGGGRPRLLNETHQQHLTAFIDDNPSVTLDQMMTSLTDQFDGLNVSKSTLYRFVRDHCSITSKKAHFHSKDRNNLSSKRTGASSK